jgi:hypothetical protein
MRHILLLPFALLMSAGPALAQDRTLAQVLFKQPADTITGGYFGLTGMTGSLWGRDAFFIGARGGVTIGHRLTLGLAGTWLASGIRNRAYEVHREQNGHTQRDGLRFNAGYGGLFIEPTLFTNSVVHLTVPVTFGAGGASYSYQKDDSQNMQRVRPDAHTFYFVQPAVEVEVNVVRNLRIGAGASYLYTTDILLPATAKDVLRQPMFQLTMKVGEF